MSIESIIIVFSLGLLASIIIFLVAGLIYSKINKVEPEEIYQVPLQQKRYIPNSSTQVGFSKYASPGRLSNYPVVDPGRRQTFSNGNFNSNGHTHPAHSSFYTVVNSSRQISYLNKQNLN
jgi:hypothetical protein